MNQKQLPELMIDYVNWRSRYVGPRPAKGENRAVGENTPALDRQCAGYRSIPRKSAKRGDLSPHLSDEPHTRGYAVVARKRGASAEDKWLDKDFVLNTTGYHHFHIGTTIEAKGHVGRTDDLIFAQVTRDEFTVVAIFDHAVFKLGSSERVRLVALHNAIVARSMAPGAVGVHVGTTIATSGHATHTVLYAQRCLRLIRYLEPRLDDLDFVRGLYQRREHAPATPKPEWDFVHLDLAIYDGAKPAFLVVQKGWN